MPLAIGLRGESKVTDSALEWSLSVVGSEMSDERALVSTGVTTEVTLVWRQSQMGTSVT